MMCSGCGKDIPFNGTVCPYCHRDKSKDQEYTVLGVIFSGGLGWLGYKLFGVWGAIGGFIVGMIACVGDERRGKYEAARRSCSRERAISAASPNLKRGSPHQSQGLTREGPD